MRPIIALLLGGFLLGSCMSPPRPPPRNEIVALARQRVASAPRFLDDASLTQVQTSEPEVRWKTIDWYLDYEVLWRLESKEMLVVSGTWSSRDKLKYSRVELRQARP